MIQDDFKSVTDSYGLVQPFGLWSGNGLLYSAEAIVALNDNKALDAATIQSFWKAYYGCMVQIGLVERLPGYKDQEGPDDYHGCALASRYLGANLAHDILVYGQYKGADKWSAEYEHPDDVKLSRVIYSILSVGGLRKVKYVYNNVNPGYFTLSSWMGRFPGLIANLKYGAGGPAKGYIPTPLEFLGWSIGLILGLFAKKENHDGWILPWTTYRTSIGRTILGWPLLKLWNWRFRKVWGNPGDLLGAYFNAPEHPIAVWLKNS